MSIKVLDQNTINQIAAGEVIDRPASVVKELLENAIDAGASVVTIEIKDGGISLIRITDNGSGIEKDDIKVAFLRHSTSKIKDAMDLLTVSSLGFRGEALSSIAAVSMVELMTKPEKQLMGIRYVIEGGREISMEEVGIPDGTTFVVRNLFFNTPARRKFLKSPQTEAGYISDIIERIALSHPEVSIRFIVNGQSKLHTPGNGNLKDVVYNIFGRDITSNVLEINASNEFIKLYGFLGKPIISRGNRTYENYFINGRYIKNNLINKAVEEAYKPFIMQHKYPFTVLQINILPEYLDVNVHPSKMELRFRNAENIYPFLLNNISDVLSGRELIPKVELDDIKQPEAPAVSIAEKSHLEEKTEPEVKHEEEISVKNKEEKPHTSVRNDTTSRPAQNVRPAESFEVKRIERERENDEKKQESAIVKGQPVLEEDTDYKTRENVKEPEKTEYKTEEPEYKAEEPEYKAEEQTLFNDILLSEKARKKHILVGQVFDTYWIVQYGDSMYIIDQHAAHEKVLYERMMSAVKNKKPVSQVLNPPSIITLSMSEEEILKKHMDVFSDLGYEIEHFGGNDYCIRAIPHDLLNIDKKELFIEMLDTISPDTGRGDADLILEKVASMSCKAAVKGNNKLSVSEANELIDELLTLENPYNCPHGRPTIIDISKTELEKKFKRIV